MHVKLKICGMRFPENIEEISQLNPDFIGFIFYPKSVRYFDLPSLPDLPENIQKVGVFVDATLDFIEEKVKQYSLNYVQLHGNESVAVCQKIQTLDLKVIKAFAVDEAFDFDILKAYENVVDYFLFDTKGKLPGGNGLTFSWELLNKYVLTKPYFLSGGIGPEDVTKIQAFLKSRIAQHCFAIDVNSKFENQLGEKDKNKLQIFKNQLYGD